MDSNYPVGICKQMCPVEEIIHREQNGLLHILETIPNVKIHGKPKADRNRVVKEFLRSAAGQHTPHIKHLRTPEALSNTIRYLLTDVARNDNVQWNVAYDFIADRLRAVRQDMIIQSFSSSKCVDLLEPMVKFYIYSAYRLCDQPISVFDPVINNNHLQECLKRLLSLYDEFDEEDTCIHKKLKSDIQQRPFMESLYILLNLGNTTAMSRAAQILLSKKNHLINKCFIISLEYWRGNFVKVCRLIVDLPPLLAACAFLHLPRIRKKALSIMSLAYNSKTLLFPVNVLEKLLLYSSRGEILKECKYYEIPLSSDGILFSKSFDNQKSEPSPKHHKIVDDLFSTSTIPLLLL